MITKFNIPELTGRNCTAYCSICDKPKKYAIHDNNLYAVCPYKGILLGVYNEAVPCASSKNCISDCYYSGSNGCELELEEWKENNKMKNNFKISKIEEQNPYVDSSKSINGGGYSQPYIEFTFNGSTGSIQDTSCGEFGVRFIVEFKGKQYSLDTMGRENEEYSSFSKNCLEDRLLSKQLKEAGYPISFKENL